MKPKYHKTLFIFLKNFSFFFFYLLLFNPSTLLSQDLIERTKLDLPYEDANAAENRLYQSTQSAKFNGSSSLQAIDLFSVNSSPITQAESELLPLEKVVFLGLEQAVLDKIIASKVEFLSLSIPVERDKYIELELVRKNLLHPNFISKSSTGEFNTSEGVFYRGVVKGEPNSIASLSLYPDKIRGFISDTNGNYEIGKLNDQNGYALFNDQSLTETPFFNCDVEDEYLETISTNIENQISQEQFAPDSVDIYIECDFDMYTKFGSSKPAVETFVTGLMNEIATIFENEAIPVRVSEILVWESSDPYASTSGNTTALLNKFEDTRKSYNGAFAMLFSTRAQAGGRAGVNRFCNNVAHGITLLTETSYQPYPTYSNWVNVTAHEIGHLFGSPHTHNCSWGPNSNKAIDDCVATEGGCGLVTTPTPTAEKGTIMSYCHTVSGSGFSLSKGFGTEPGDLIRNRYQNAACQTTCSHLPSDLTPIAASAANCTPQTSLPYLNQGWAGIMSIIIGDNETSSSYTAADEAYYGGDGHIDFTDRCHRAFVLDEGDTYSVSLTTWVNGHNVKAWIDYNNNNVFDEPTELIFSINTSNRVGDLTSGTGSFTVDASATLDTYLKLRFIGDLNTVTGPCYNPQRGQCEDYAVIIKSAPVTCTNPTPSLGTITNPSTCGGNGSIQLTGLAVSTTYTLNYKEDNISATPVNFTTNGAGQHTITNLGKGAYTEINVTIATCTSANLSTTLSDPAVPSSAMMNGTATITEGNSTPISVSITGGTGPYSLVYSDGSTDYTLGSYNTGMAITVSPITTTTYTIVSITDNNGCQTASNTNTGNAVITVNPSSSCPNTLNVTAVADGQTYQAANTLTSSIVIPSNNTVTFLAGQSITLGVGFQAAPTSTHAFTAAISSCSPLQAPSVARNNISNPDEQIDLSLSPNPASEFVTIDYQLGKMSTARIGLYDMTGKKLTDIVPMQTQVKGKYQQQFNLGNLQAGMYFVLLQTETEQISKKLILVR